MMTRNVPRGQWEVITLPLMSVNIPPAASAGLHPPGSWGSLGEYLRRMWQRRSYLIHVPRADLAARNQATVLGYLWHLLNPVLNIAVYYLVFGVILGVTRGVEYFVAFLAVGIFVFQYTQKSITEAARSLDRKKGLMRSISFPRALLPLSATVTETLAFVPGVAVMMGVTVLVGAPVRMAWTLLLVLVVWQFIFNAGAGLLAARLTHQFPDLVNVLPYVFRLLFYGSGVLFSVTAYVDNETMRALFVLNPMYCLLELYRWSVLGMPAQWGELVSLGIWTVVLVVLGFWLFRQSEATYGA